VSVSPNGNYVYSGTDSPDETVRKLWAANGSWIWNFTGHTGNVFGVSAGPDGNHVYSGGGDAWVRKLWSVNGSWVWNASIPNTVASVSAGPDGNSVYSGDHSDVLRKLQTSDGSEVWNFTGFTNVVRSVSAGPEGQYAYGGSQDNTVRQISSRYVNNGSYLSNAFDAGSSLSWYNLTVDLAVDNWETTNATVEVSDSQDFSTVKDSQEVSLSDGLRNYSLNLQKAQHGRVNFTLSSTRRNDTPVVNSFTLWSADNSVPNVSFVSPTPDSGSYLSSSSLEVNVSASDKNLANVTLDLYNSSDTLINRTISGVSPLFRSFSLSDGLYKFNGSANDSVGNTNFTVTRNVTLDTKSPSASVSVSDDSVSQGSSVKISCSSSDESGVSSRKVTVTDPNGDKLSSGCGNDFGDTDVGGSYTVDLKVTDRAGNSNSDSAEFEVSSSGGGGGGTSAGDTEAGAQEVSSSKAKFLNLKEGKQYTMDTLSPSEGVDETEVATESLSFKTSEGIDEASIEFAEYKERPEEVETDAAKSVYRYQYVDASKELDEKISGASMQFRIKKGWLEDNNISGFNITLRKKVDGEWQDRSTSLTGEDKEFARYSAELEGFSYLAIAIKEVKEDEREDIRLDSCPFECCVDRANYTDKECGSGEVCENNQCVEVKEEPGEKKEKTEKDTGISPWWFVAALILLGLIYGIYRKKYGD
ncbi:MAG: PGF-pre-PGF domain-containing protein, partial [Candidatus Nanohaloarchaea archaeon]|nr:PGF-pre-PGF domain-containing protein [Candidatus Nanohaloarchaea archaeon]